MNLKNGLTFIFDDWWRPIIFFGFALLILLCNLFISDIFKGLVAVFLPLSLLGLLLSAMYQFFKKRWKEGVWTIGVILGAFIMLILLAPAVVAD